MPLPASKRRLLVPPQEILRDREAFEKARDRLPPVRLVELPHPDSFLDREPWREVGFMVEEGSEMLMLQGGLRSGCYSTREGALIWVRNA